MSDSARDLLVRGIAAAKAGDNEQARFYLEWVLRTDADHRQQTDAWYYLSQITDDPVVRRDSLENVLALEPTHPEARRALAILDARLDPNDLIDANRPSTPSPTAPQPATAKRFTCQNCGGKMAFSPDRHHLTCAYCSRQITLNSALQDGGIINEHDFALALATARGHTRPVDTHSLTCQACGAQFVLPQEALSFTCPYCRSAYVAKIDETRSLIPPTALIPFSVNQDQAAKALAAWLDANLRRQHPRPGPPAGLYLPAWTFDLGGEVHWHGFVIDAHCGTISQSARTGSYPIYSQDVLVPASHTLPHALTPALYDFQLSALVPYAPAYLADWPTQIYQISVADASLVARQRVWEDARHTLATRTSAEFGYVRDLTLSSAAMMIQSYKLITLPIWVARYRLRGRDHTTVINGQTGTVHAETPTGGLMTWLSRLF